MLPSSRVVPTFALLMAALLGACSSPSAPPGPDAAGAASDVAFVATMPQGLSSADVVRVGVRVSGPGIASPLAFELGRSGDTWRGTLADIPAGTARQFEAAAYGAQGQVLYRGHSGPVTVEGGGGAPTIVAVVMQEESPPPSFENTAPVIDSLAVSRAEVVPGATLSLSAEAHDVDSGDVVGFAWTASGGSFSAPGAAATAWTAPTAQGTYRLTLTVTDGHEASATLGVDVRVAVSPGVGSAEVTVTANGWPSVRAMNALPSRPVVAQPVRLGASASDPDGDSLQYSWASTCAGSFSNAGSAAPEFTLASLPTSGRCAFTVTAADGRGGSGAGTLTLLAGEGPQANFAPQVDSVFKSAELALAGETVLLRLSAHDPEGSALRFSWASAEGVLGHVQSTATTSEVQWTAPPCFDAPRTVVATAVDAAGLATSQAFEVGPRSTASCSGTTVSGTRIQHFAPAEGAEIQRAVDLRAAVIAAWVPREDGSGYDYRPGVGREDGTFSIYGVERTPYLLQLDHGFYQVDARTVDLSFGTLGRPDVEAAPAGTRLQLALSNLVPWTFYDDVQLNAPNAGVGYFSMSCSDLAPPQNEGVTVLEGSFDYAQFPCGVVAPPLLEPSKGDTLYAAHLAARPVAGGQGSVQELRRAVQVPVSLAEGAYVLAAPLQSLPLHGLEVDVRTRELEAFATQAHPAGQLLPGTGFGVGVSPVPQGFGIPGGWPDLAYGTFQAVGAPDLVEPLEFGNPYPTSWSQFAYATAVSSIRVRLPMPSGGTGSRQAFAYVSVQREVPSPSTAPVTLRSSVGPVGNLTLDGAPATTELTGLGTTPVLAWDAPAVGTPTHYTVRIYRFALPASGSSFLDRTTVAQLYTQDRSLRIPPGLLVAGETYVFVVSALEDASHDPRAPLRSGGTFATAQALTSPFHP